MKHWTRKHNPDTPPDSSDPAGPCPRCGRVSNFNVEATVPVSFEASVYAMTPTGTQRVEAERAAILSVRAAGNASDERAGRVSRSFNDWYWIDRAGVWVDDPALIRHFVDPGDSKLVAITTHEARRRASAYSVEL